MSQELRLIRRITLKLIPFLILLYLIAYVDRSAVGFAKLHMGADIGLGDAAYGLGAGLFFIGYFLLEIPSNLMLDRFGARRWFARIMVTWGAITIGMAFVQGPNSFYLMRFLLGAAEAGFFPGVLYYITQWFPVRHRGKILGLFILSQPIAMMITGPMSGGLLGMDGVLGLHGWQWLFIVIGTPAILLTWPVLRWLPDGPQQVKWMDQAEKDWLSGELKKDLEQYGQTRHGNPLHALKDKRVLLLALFYLPVTLSIYGLGLWLPTLIKQFGGTDLVTGFVSSVPYIFGIIGLLIIPRSSDRLNDRYGHLAGAVRVGCHRPVLQRLAVGAGAATGGAVPGGVRAVFLHGDFLDLARSLLCRRERGGGDRPDQLGGQPRRLHRPVRDRRAQGIHRQPGVGAVFPVLRDGVRPGVDRRGVSPAGAQACVAGG